MLLQNMIEEDQHGKLPSAPVDMEQDTDRDHMNIHEYP